MRQLALIALLGALFWAYQADLFSSIGSPKGAFAEDGSPTILLFTTPQCKEPCANVISELHRRRADFEEIVVLGTEGDENTTRWKEMGGRLFPHLVAGRFSDAVANGPEVSSLLAKTFSSQYLTRDEKQYYEGHFNDYNEPMVMMYGADWCPYCQKLQKELKAANIPFAEIDVPKHRNKDAMAKTMDIRGYPSTWVGYHRVKGHDINAVKATIKVATQYKQ